jgi:hypothetical protein
MEPTKGEAATRITQLSWGRIEVTIGETRHEFKDCKVWPGGAVEWDWDLTGTRHSPGIQVADIEEILQHGIDVMVLSRGLQLRLQTSPDTQAELQRRGIEIHVEETTAAVERFNALAAQGVRVGGIFHSTC